MDLARLRLEDDPTWNNGKIEAIMGPEETGFASSAERRSDMILYWAVFTDHNGPDNARVTFTSGALTCVS